MTDSTYQQRLAKRYASEKRFKAYGAIALILTSAFLIYLLVDIVIKGTPAFFEHRAQLSVTLDGAAIDKSNPGAADYATLVKNAWRAQFPDVTSRTDKKKLNQVLSQDASEDLRQRVIADPTLIGQAIKTEVLLSDNADLYFKGQSDGQADALYDKVKATVPVAKHLSLRLFTNSDSREPELAGLRGAIFGSLFTVAVALGLGLPVGVAAALYLEQFAPKNRWTDRSQHQQSCRGAINHFRPVRPCHVSQCLRHAALGTTRGWSGVGPAGSAHHHHSIAGRIESRASLHQGSRLGRWRIGTASHFPSRPAAGISRHSDRSYSGPGARLWRNRTIAHDWHGGLHRGCTERVH
jgi:hypothetical protein